MKEKDNNVLSIIVLYKIYLYAIREREEYGDLYGDTDEIIRLYEEELEKRMMGNYKMVYKKN